MAQMRSSEFVIYATKQFLIEDRFDDICKNFMVINITCFAVIGNTVKVVYTSLITLHSKPLALIALRRQAKVEELKRVDTKNYHARL